MPRYYTWRDAEGRMVNTPYDGKRKESEATGETSHKILETEWRCQIVCIRADSIGANSR